MTRTKKYMQVILVFVGFITILSSTSCSFQKKDFYIFEDISDCENITEHLEDETKLEIYDTPEKDPALKDIEYKSFYAARYKSRKMDFEIFAYEFKNAEDLEEYCTNKDECYESYGIKSQGLFYTFIYVADENRAYSLYTNTFDDKEVKEILEKTFSIKK